METNRYIIVVNSGRGRHRAWKILDRVTLTLSTETYDYKPVAECKRLNEDYTEQLRKSK